MTGTLKALNLREMPTHRYRRKAESSPRSFRREQEKGTQPGASILIVTEGVNTEPVYFECIRRLVAAHLVELVTHGAGRGDPRKLAEMALALRIERRRKAKRGELSLHQLEDFDEVWIVFDADVLNPQKLHEGIAFAKSKGIRWALSEPCFEYWLLLHCKDAYTTALMPKCNDVLPYLRRAYGWQRYDKGLHEATKLIEPLVKRDQIVTAMDAASRVRQYHQSAGTAFPQNPSTDVDLLVSVINEALPPSKKLR